MSATKDIMEYDEDDAVKFIQNYLPQELKGKFSNDEINYVIDIIYEYYESIGLMDESSSEDEIVDIDEDALISFVQKNTKKDRIREFSAEDITFLVQGELAYCESINIFD